MTKPYLSGKEFCNCEHAQMFVNVCRKAYSQLLLSNTDEATQLLRDVIDAHDAGEQDYHDFFA